MELTREQTDKILKKLRDSNLEIISTDEVDLFNLQVVDEEYFWEKVNEALE